MATRRIFEPRYPYRNNPPRVKPAPTVPEAPFRYKVKPCPYCGALTLGTACYRHRDLPALDE
jgi:hypothetical protein